MHFVCKLDIELYGCITRDIISDDVIITDERIKHIIDRRGVDFYMLCRKHFAEIIENPDYIFADKKNTALVCKSFADGDNYVNIVLRLATSTDNPNYKNSILTVICESNKRFKQRIRNNKALYKQKQLL